MVLKAGVCSAAGGAIQNEHPCTVLSALRGIVSSGTFLFKQTNPIKFLFCQNLQPVCLHHHHRRRYYLRRAQASDSSTPAMHQRMDQLGYFCTAKRELFFHGVFIFYLVASFCLYTLALEKPFF